MNEYRFKVSNGRGFRWMLITSWTALDAEDLAYANLLDGESLVQMSKVFPGGESMADESLLPRSTDQLLEVVS